MKIGWLSTAFFAGMLWVLLTNDIGEPMCTEQYVYTGFSALKIGVIFLAIWLAGFTAGGER